MRIPTRFISFVLSVLMTVSLASPSMAVQLAVVETGFLEGAGVLESADGTVRVSYSPDAGIPEGAFLDVRPVGGAMEEACRTVAERNAAEGETMAWASFLDITILDGSGTEIEPRTPVSVEITLPIEEQLTAWASEMLADNVNVSKTAKVSDYGNRIYEITLAASSGVRRVVPTLDLEFITDVSRSMYFPATLEPVAEFTQGTKASRYWRYNQWNWDPYDSTLYDWLNNNGDTGTVY